MRKILWMVLLAIAVLAAYFIWASRPNAAELTYACGGINNYYCQGIGSSFAKKMGTEANGSHSVTLLPTAGSFEIADKVCSGEAHAGSLQADVYALKREADREFSRCAFALGLVTEEAVLVAAPEGTVWGQFRKPNPATDDGKWLILVKAGSGALGPAQLISMHDAAIAEHVIFEEVPADQYDFTSILGDISFGDADAVLWVQAIDPRDGDMLIVNQTAGIDFVPTGFQKYEDEIQVGNRRKAPVYRVAEMPVESTTMGGLDLMTGGGRKMPLLMVGVVPTASSSVDAAVREQMKTVFASDGIAPATSFAARVMSYYAAGMDAGRSAWALVD